MERAIAVNTFARGVVERATHKRHRHAGCLKPMETVMHYVRMLNGIPSRDSDGGSSQAEDLAASLFWRCTGCGTMVPRSQAPPNTCPHCGAAKQHIA